MPKSIYPQFPIQNWHFWVYSLQYHQTVCHFSFACWGAEYPGGAQWAEGDSAGEYSAGSAELFRLCQGCDWAMNFGLRESQSWCRWCKLSQFLFHEWFQTHCPKFGNCMFLFCFADGKWLHQLDIKKYATGKQVSYIFIQSFNFRLANHRHQSTWESKQHPGTGPTLQLDPSLRFLVFF